MKRTGLFVILGVMAELLLAQGAKQTRPFYEGTTSDLMTVKADGRDLTLYTDSNFWGGVVHFGSYQVKRGRNVTLRIHTKETIRYFEILPKTLEMERVRKTSPHSIEVKLRQPEQSLTLILNGQPKKNVLHLFPEQTEVYAAWEKKRKEHPQYWKSEEEKLIYFGPGFHDLKQETGSYGLNIPSGWTFYAAKGAVLKGHLLVRDCKKGTRLMGQGMIYNDKDDASVLLTISNSSDVEVRDLCFHGHRAQVWQVIVNASNGIHMEGVKILSTRYASTDGLDVVNSQNCSFKRMFIRASDDAVAVKGLQGGKPEQCAPNKNILFEDLQLWSDCNSGFTFGAETRASAYEDITLRRSQVLFSYDDPNHHLKLDERAALSICCLHGTWFRRILYEDIDVYHCERLIALGFQPSFWFGSIPGDHSTEGGIRGVTFRRVRSMNTSHSMIANGIHLYGWKQAGTPDKWTEDILFEDLEIEGKKIRSTDTPYYIIEEGVRQVRFK